MCVCVCVCECVCVGMGVCVCTHALWGVAISIDHTCIHTYMSCVHLGFKKK